MKNNLLSRAIHDLRSQPVIGTVTVIGTALSVFLIMVVVMMFQVKVQPFGPEINRDRTLYVPHIHFMQDNGRMGFSGTMSIGAADLLFKDLPGAEAIAVFTGFMSSNDVTDGTRHKEAIKRTVNNDYWKIFSYDFLAGHPLTDADAVGSEPGAVLAESVARVFFDSPDDAIGKRIYVVDRPYRVAGVIKDVTPLAQQAFGEVYVPITQEFIDNEHPWNQYGGEMAVALLAKSPSDLPALKAESEARYRAFQEQLPETDSIYSHGAPYNIEELSLAQWSNQDPDVKGERRKRYIIYAILLLIPALNLSTMSRSRLQRRVSELGVRRTYGATRWSILRDILIENFFITLVGALIGIAMCFIYGSFFSSAVFTNQWTGLTDNAPLEILFNWRLLGFTIIFCFLLNLLSSGIPAWRASRINPVDALNNR